MDKLAALLIIILAGFGGVAGGMILNNNETNKDATEPVVEKETDPVKSSAEYLKLGNQFLIPLVEDGSIDGLIALSVGLELDPSEKERVYGIEPKLRDVFLQVMFDHANIGGFQGQFTNSANLMHLKRNLLEVAQNIAGEGIYGVLITDIARQDM